MFNMTLIGQRISRLRKEKNMTQMALADEMGISFQAVSNWERGNSMPDVEKLPQLAQILGVTVDQLLSDQKAAQTIHKVIEDKQAPLTGEELSSVAQILKPKQADEAAQRMRGINISDLAEMAPFLSETALSRIIRRAMDEGNLSFDREGLKQFMRLAPHLDEDDLASIVTQALSQGSLTLDGEGIKQFVQLAPLLDEDDLAHIVTQALNHGRLTLDEEGVKQFVQLAPLLDEDALSQLVKAAMAEGTLSVANLIPLAPLLPEETLTPIVKDYMRKGELKAVIGLLPFIDGDDLGDMF